MTLSRQRHCREGHRIKLKRKKERKEKQNNRIAAVSNRGQTTVILCSTITIAKPTVQQYQQCCHLANGNKTCRSLLLFKNNNVARRSQGFVRQSSRNVALRVEQPSMHNKFFFSELQYSASFGRESRKFAGGV